METDDSAVLSLLKAQLNRVVAEIEVLEPNAQRHERLVVERAALLKWIEAVERGLV